MSGDSIDFNGLERKDRAELVTIAQALGGKPTSRARKADLVKLILELAGVPAEDADGVEGAVGAPYDSSEPATPQPASEEATEPAANGQDSGPSDDGPSGRSAQGRASTATDQESDSGGSGSKSQRRASGKGDGQLGAADSGSTGSRHGGGERSNGRDQGKGRDSVGGTDKPQQDVARSGSPGEGASQKNSDGDRSGNGESDDNSGQEGESRRRRRRRGRDRDRTDDGAETQWEGEPVEVAGTLDLRDEGYGFLRVDGVLPSRDDVYVSVKQTRQLGLRRGDWLTGTSRPASRGEKNPALLRVDTVNGSDPTKARDRHRFEDLVPVFPSEPLRLEREDHPYDVTSRIIDLIAPIGKGQRGLIVSPPKAGKTTVMKTIAQAIEQNHPEVELIVVLLDERPEEVTDMRRSVTGAVVASTFDRPPEEHTQVAELVIERAKRMVEQGQDVVVIVDGITRLSRAYNLAAPTGGRIMSGGLDTGALYPPKRFFGAARNIEDGGSLTILATALVDTNSKMDDVIFEEFKGTGNMELRLDRAAAERRIFPAIDFEASSTRHEELLIDADRLQQIWKLRRLLAALGSDGEPGAGLDLVIDRMRKFPTNDSFLAEIAKGPAIR